MNDLLHSRRHQDVALFVHQVVLVARVGLSLWKTVDCAVLVAPVGVGKNVLKLKMFWIYLTNIIITLSTKWQLAITHLLAAPWLVSTSVKLKIIIINNLRVCWVKFSNQRMQQRDLANYNN